MSIDSKDSLVWLKSMARAQSLPLDSTEVFSSVEEAQTYASTSAVAYAGQTVKALGSDGVYSTYILQPSESDGYSLEELSAEESSQPVVEEVDSPIKVVTELPESDQEEGVLYIVNSEGYVWSDSSWNRIFHDQTSRINEAENRIIITENRLDSKIESSKITAVTEAATAANTARETRIGEISSDTTVKAYIDEAFAASQGNETLTELMNKTITNFAFHDDTTEIKDGTFYGCTELALTSLPKSVTSIGDYAFCNCYKLALTSLPENLNEVGKYAFRDCRSLALTSLPTSMYDIKEGTFYGCSSLALTSFPEYAYDYRGGHIAKETFYNCDNIAFTALPNFIAAIEDGAFYSCSRLALNSLPSSLYAIGNDAFAFCTGLKLTSLPDGLQSIGDSAFYNCYDAVKLASLPDSVTSIGAYAFTLCTGLTLTSLPDNVTAIGEGAFYDCRDLALTSLPKNTVTIKDKSFERCSKLALTSLPESVCKIESYAFNGCTELALTSLPSGLSVIGFYAFGSCTNLKTITFTNDAQTPNITISPAAFNDCTNLTTINVPWEEGAVAYAPWGATNATINYNYVAS